jgi:hypothetical protein
MGKPAMGREAAALRRPVKTNSKKNGFTVTNRLADPTVERNKDPKSCSHAGCGAVALFKVGMKGFCYEHKAEAYATAKAEPGREMFLPE